MRTFVITLVALTVLAAASFAAPYGLLFTYASEPIAATSSTATVEKSGSSTAYGVLYMFGIGDAGITPAMKKAGITEIHHIDKTTIGLPLSCFVMETTTVYGK